MSSLMPPPPPQKHRTWRWWLAGSLVIGLGVFGLGRFYWKTPLTTVVVERRKLIEAVDASGTVTAVDAVVLKAESTGRVLTRPVSEDKPVVPGTPLLTLDDHAALLNLAQTKTSAANAVMQAQTALASAQATLKEAIEEQRVNELMLIDQVRKAENLAAQSARELARNQTLADEGGIALQAMDSLRQQHSQAELDVRIAKGNLAKVRAGASVLLARNQVAQAEAALASSRAQGEKTIALAQDAMNKATVRAPMAGRVAVWLVAPGDWVAPGTPLGKFFDQHALRLRLPVDELDVTKLREGQTARIAFDAYPEEPFTGRITRIARSSELGEAGVQAYPVEIAFDDPHDRIRPGMNAEAHVQVREVADALAIPLGAARREGQKLVVTRVTPAGKQETVPITPGISTLEYMEVRGGLSLNDRLVMSTTGGKR